MFWGPPNGGMCPEHLTTEVSGRLAHHALQHGRAAALLELLLDGPASHPISEGEPIHLAPLVPAISFQSQALGRNEDRLVNYEHRQTSAEAAPILPVNLLLYPSLTHEQDPEVLELLHLGSISFQRTTASDLILILEASHFLKRKC